MKMKTLGWIGLTVALVLMLGGCGSSNLTPTQKTKLQGIMSKPLISPNAAVPPGGPPTGAMRGAGEQRAINKGLIPKMGGPAPGQPSTPGQ